MRPESVLVIDDQRGADELRGMLDRIVRHVWMVETAEPALDLLESKPDIGAVLVAADMPDGTSGAAFISKVRVCYPATAFVLVAPSPVGSGDPTIPVLLKPLAPPLVQRKLEQLCAETRRTMDVLQTTSNWNSDGRRQLEAARAALRVSVRRSRAQLVERFWSDVRSAVRPGPTVLVAEDDPILLYSIDRMLTRSDARVLTAGSPAEALQASRCHEGVIELLLTDFHMPGDDPLDWIGVFEAERPRAKVMIMTADDIRLPRPTLRKPFELEDLLGEIACVLMRR